MAGRCDKSCGRCPSGWREEGDADDASAPIVGIAVGSAVAGVVGLIVVAVIIVVVVRKQAHREEIA
jgi:hypothetical protein